MAGFGRRRLTLGLGERDDEGERVVKMVSECLCCVWVKTGPNAPLISFLFFFFFFSYNNNKNNNNSNNKDIITVERVTRVNVKTRGPNPNSF